jgi:hypothetical protein
MTADSGSAELSGRRPSRLVSRGTVVMIVLAVLSAGTVAGIVWFEYPRAGPSTGVCTGCGGPTHCYPMQLILTAPNSSSPFPATFTSGGRSWYNYSLLTNICTAHESISGVYFSVQTSTCQIAAGVSGIALTPRSSGTLQLVQNRSTGWWNTTNATSLNSPAALNITASSSLTADQLLIDYGQPNRGGIEVYEGAIAPDHTFSCTPSSS